MSARTGGPKEAEMHERFLLKLGLILILVAAIGCAARVRRAPIDTIPGDVDPDTRVEMLEEMTLKYPDDANLYFEIGNHYYDAVMPVEARTNYERALALDPDFNKARVNLAMLLVESDEVDSAKALLEEAIRREPKEAKAYNNLGMVYYSELDVAKAVEYFRRALEIDPANAEAHYNLGLAFAESGLVLEAIREWRAVLDLVEEGETADRAKMSLERAERQLRE
jgi:tetratricopeptide (TPR) repeat protein